MRGEDSFTARVVSKFLTSKLSLLFIIAALAAGAVGFLKTPREEEPQIVVPMVDVLINFPGTIIDTYHKAAQHGPVLAYLYLAAVSLGSVIILAVFFWGSALGGIMGMILAIPLTAFLVVFWRLAEEKYIGELV